MNDTVNRQIVMASRPSGAVTPGNFRLVEAPMPRPGPGEVRVRNLWLSLDPYMRGRMSAAKSYAKGMEIGEVMVGQTVGEVVESNDPALAPGAHVLGSLGWQLYGVAKGADLVRVDGTRAPLSHYLGVLGMPGLTAWFGLNEIGQPKAGETLVVSAATGAVGSVVGQLARIAGCRVVGIAGGPAKREYALRELGLDACIDHRAPGLPAALAAACPSGVDVCFENVGGEILDATLALANLRARFVICGLISEYDRAEPHGLRNLRSVLVNRVRMQGMIVFDWAPRYGEGVAALAAHVAAGRIRYRESVADGLESAPRAFIGMLRGENFGKQLVRLS